VLIEDAPGLGKTNLAKSIALSIRNARFKRIQFTPDMLPSDVTGVSVYHPKLEQFEFMPGPVFTEVLLADEVNRTSPKTQSSLLEAMEERQVTVDGVTRSLSGFFMVLATQNPIELEGTFPLPEAQIDRFLMRLEIGYPSESAERDIVSSHIHEPPVTRLEPVLDIEEVTELQGQVRDLPVSEEVRNYAVDLVRRTREHPDVRLGASPRGSVALMLAAQAFAFISGESYVTPDSVKSVALPVLAHRLILNPQNEYAGVSRHDIIRKVLEAVPVPVLPEGDG
ncbi:MAG: MoxR family ATPase, partial [Planctomycetes bacterium]|nr:MoxR family ATPase [Planctomycetota bacterium]